MTREAVHDGPSPSRRSVLAGVGAGTAGLVGLGSAHGRNGTDGKTTGFDDEPAPVEGTFVEASTSTAVTPNPIEITDTTTANRLDKLYDGPGGQFGPETFDPRWFEGWELSDDYRVVEYTVRDGLEWGGPYGQLTAEDYVYSLENVVLADWFQHADAGEYELGPDREQVTYERTGPLSFRAELPMPRPQWLHEDPLLDLVALPRRLLEPYVSDQNKDGILNDDDVVEGTLSEGNLGPYTFERWDRGSRWVYRRNDDYYMQDHADEAPFAGDQYYDFRNAPYFEEYRVEVFDEQSTAQTALRTGEVDFTTFGAQGVEDVRGSRNVDVWESRYGNDMFWLNINHRINGWAPLRESREVRQAMGNLYDRETIIQQVNQGNALPMSTFHPSWGPYYPDESDMFVPEGTVEKAKSLLESGTSSDYGYDENGTVRGPEGSQVQLKAPRPTGSETTEIAASYMSDRLAEAGINLEVDALNWSSVLRNYAINSPANVDGVDEPDWSAGAYNGGPWNQSASNEEWDLLFGLGFSTSPYAPWDTLEVTMAENGGFNLWGYHQDQVDVRQELEDARSASDSVTTVSKMRNLFSWLSRDVALVWTKSEVTFEGYSERIGGYPGEERSWGASADSPFHQPDPARLLRVGDDAPPRETTTTERPTSTTTTERPTPTETTSDPTAATPTATTGPSSTPTDGDAEDTESGDDGTDGDVEFGDGDGGSVPGFDALAALGGVAGLAEYARRRGGGDDGED